MSRDELRRRCKVVITLRVMIPDAGEDPHAEREDYFGSRTRP